MLAGAGTGKTAVITGKVAHLVRNEGVPPPEILVLAFNRKAAEEVRERLPDDLADARVATFHAFGRRVLAGAGAAPTMSKLAEDESQLDRAVDGILGELLVDPRQSDAVTDFILSHRAAYRSQFDFATPGEYYDYVRRSELRTLSGDLVKSFEELAIAKFLSPRWARWRRRLRGSTRSCESSRETRRREAQSPDQRTGPAHRRSPRNRPHRNAPYRPGPT